MKKFILLSAALFACGALYAESMQFVTLLSSPLGTFSRLETADPTVRTKSTRVNFCTTKVTTGAEIRFERVSPSITFLNLANGTTLAGALTNYYTTTRFDLASGGTVKGKALLASNLTYQNATSAKSKVSNTMTVRSSATFKGGYATELDIPDTAKSVDSPADNLGEELHWSNTYQCEAYDVNGACPTGKNTTKYAKSFVLKSKNAASPCVGPKGASYTESCPLGKTGSITYIWNTATCSYTKRDNCQASTKKKCLTKRRWCHMMDIGTGALNDGGVNPNIECSTIRRGSGFLLACALAHDIYGTTENYNDIFEAKPYGCEYGQECDACTLGQKYASTNSGIYCKGCADSTYMYGPGSRRTIYNIAYAQCAELDDCTEGEEADCSQIGNGTGGEIAVPMPMDPVVGQF